MISADKFVHVPTGRFLMLTCRVDPAEDIDGYVASCPALGVVSQGDTIEEAENNIREAVCLYLTVVHEDNELEDIITERGLKLALMDDGFEEVVRTATGSRIVEAFPIPKAA